MLERINWSIVARLVLRVCNALSEDDNGARALATVLITDGLERAALAVCRSLAAARHDVHVTTPVRHSLAGVSRGVREHPLDADPVRRPADFAQHVGELAGRLRARVVLPISDPSLGAILEHHDQIPHDAVVPFPRYDAFRAASDKVRLLPMARAAGFEVPESSIIASRTDVDMARLDAYLPGVLKPHRSVVRRGGAQQRLGVLCYETVGDAQRILAQLPDEAYPVLAQRRIEGIGIGFFALRWNGNIRAAFAHRRLREIPPTGGVSVYRESIGLDPDLAGPGTRLLEALDWNGVAMVECKRESATGKYFIMEINPRFWGSLQLAIDAGVDFPRLLIDCALGQCANGHGDYRVGIRSRWFWGEMDFLYLTVKQSHTRRSRACRLWRALAGVMRHRIGRDRCEVLRLRDPLPFLVETIRRLGILQ